MPGLRVPEPLVAGPLRALPCEGDVSPLAKVRRWGSRAALAAIAASVLYWAAVTRVHVTWALFGDGPRISVLELLAQVSTICVGVTAAVFVIWFLVEEARR